MTDRIHSPATREAAIRDYQESGDTYAVVAARHGMSRSRLHALVNPGGPKRKRKSQRWDDEEVAYLGSAQFDPSSWVMRGGVLHPLYPERRSA